MPTIERGYLPTPAEIRQRCVVIQSRWTPQVRAMRAIHFAPATSGYRTDGVTVADLDRHWTPPMVTSPPDWCDQ